MPEESDAVLVQEVVRGQREIENPDFGSLVIKRPTPRVEALIATIRGQKQHEFLQDETILSTKEIEDLAARRGMWTEEDETQKLHLTRRLGEIMGVLQSLGYETSDKAFDDYGEILETLGTEVGQDPKAVEAIARYFDLDADGDLADHKIILDAAESTNLDDTLEEAEVRKAQVKLLVGMSEVQGELMDLQERYSRLFMDSLENRVFRAETLAKVFYNITYENGDRLWSTFDDIWDTNPDVLGALMDQLFYFENGIDEDQQEVLAKFGFFQRAIDSDAESDDSLDPPTSNSDGESPENTSEASSESETPSS